MTDPVDQEPTISIDPSALDFYFDSVLPEIPLITRRGMSSAIARGFDAHYAKKTDQAIIDWREKMSTDGRPLSTEPLIIKQPVSCPRCGAEEYADWTLYPHQVYNHYMPGGIGHYCFDCFCAIVVEKNAEPDISKEINDGLDRLYGCKPESKTPAKPDFLPPYGRAGYSNTSSSPEPGE